MSQSVKFLYQRNMTSPTEKDASMGKTHSLSCKGGITVGYIWNEATKELKMAVARCCDKDNFNRRVARDIVTGRLLSKRPGSFETVVLDVEGKDWTPKAVEEMVYGWLEAKEESWAIMAERNRATLH